jgi:hypothetical protein
MTRARKTFLKQRQGPGQGAHARRSLQATFGWTLEPRTHLINTGGPRVGQRTSADCADFADSCLSLFLRNPRNLRREDL